MVGVTKGLNVDIDKIRSEGQAKIAQADKLTKEAKERIEWQN